MIYTCKMWLLNKCIRSGLLYAASPSTTPQDQRNWQTQRNRTLTLSGLKARADTFSAAMVACSKALGTNGSLACVAVILAATVDQVVKYCIYACNHIYIYYAFVSPPSITVDPDLKGMGFYFFHPDIMLTMSTTCTACDVHEILPTL